ncbi:MAG TPA: hypothetical protein VFT42_01495 [Solirubrobacteraceae bacterium]|nr:hypothetical protein [Solirubrobacteraceae bacterium]
MPRPRPIVLLVALLALVAAAVAGCGGSGGGSSASAQELLADTFGSGGTHVRSGDLNVALDIRANGFQTFKGPLHIALSGPFQTGKPGALPKFDFDLSFGSAGSSISAGAVSTGSKGYLKLGGHAYVLPDSAFRSLAKAGSNGKSSGISLKSLGIDPRRWVTNVEKQGVETVAGAQTVHLSAGIDVGRLLGDVNTVLGKATALGIGGATGGVPSGLSAATRTKISRSIDQAHVDIWTGKDDHALRRLLLNVHFDVPSDLLPKGSSGQSGTVKLDLSIANLNQPQPIGAPANPRPLAELTTALQQLAVQAQGAAGGTGSGTTPAPSGGGSKYDSCVAKAGTDLAKIQACSSLLGQ